MGALVFLIPVLFGIGMIRNYRGLRGFFVKPDMRSSEASQKAMMLVVGWGATLLGSAVLVMALARALVK